MNGGWEELDEGHCRRVDGVEIRSREGSDRRLYWYVDVVPDLSMAAVDSPAVSSSRDDLIRWIDRTWPMPDQDCDDRRSMELAVISMMVLSIGVIIAGAYLLI